jgi:hypothetical protein
MHLVIIRFDGALLVAASILFLVETILFLGGDPYSDRWPRWMTYAIGVGTIWVAFTALNLARPSTNAPLDLAVLIIAAFNTPTVGRAIIYWREHEAACKQERDAVDVKLAKADAMVDDNDAISMD